MKKKIDFIVEAIRKERKRKLQLRRVDNCIDTDNGQIPDKSKDISISTVIENAGKDYETYLKTGELPKEKIIAKSIRKDYL